MTDAGWGGIITVHEPLAAAGADFHSPTPASVTVTIRPAESKQSQNSVKTAEGFKGVRVVSELGLGLDLGVHGALQREK